MRNHRVRVTAACLGLAEPLWPLVSLLGACPEVLARQRAAAARLLEVLADLDRAHEEFQQQEREKVALGPLGP